MNLMILIVGATVENPWGSLEKTVPSGEFLGCLHCAAGQCEGSLGIFLGPTLGCKTSGAAPPPHCPSDFQQLLSWENIYSHVL